MNVPDARLAGAASAMRRLRIMLWVVAPLLAFCAWTRLPPPSTPVSRLMAQALPEAASEAERRDEAPSQELAFVSNIAELGDWVCYFWEYERIRDVVQRDTGRTVSTNIDLLGDKRAWALVIGEQAHVMPIWSSYALDRRKSALPRTYRKCTRLSETRVLKRGSYLVLEDAE